jgi:hypothetical protein
MLNLIDNGIISDKKLYTEKQKHDITAHSKQGVSAVVGKLKNNTFHNSRAHYRCRQDTADEDPYADTETVGGRGNARGVEQ